MTPAKPEKKGLPGFEGAIAIAGLLAITYMIMRRKR
ncbi:MAG: PGF-CTERM sorting domain-containing protein [Methanosarcinales archaeon]|nr:PGF-CTERM sorting domain-containing protein [Methanosarcinales archaeon]